MPVCPFGSAGEGQMIGFGVVPVLTPLVDALPASGGCCACANSGASKVATLRIILRRLSIVLQPGCCSTGRHRSQLEPVDLVRARAGQG